MLKKLPLSDRLQLVASYLSAGTIFADIGSDHAYLPCYVCSRDKTAKAIAGELNEGPFMRAQETVQYYGLTEKIDVRLGNGLQVINNEDKVKEVVIAGMGGALIKTILQDGQEKLASVHRIITQPNVDARSVRQWLLENRFTIISETIIEDHGHIYEIIVADKGSEMNPYDETVLEQQLLFGPLLLKNRTPVFQQKWQAEYEKRSLIIEQMKSAKQQNEEKLTQFEKELAWMKEVLQYNDAFNK
ncbi:tRNA (adenine22-N1)-methyltransferase [Virgibacillus halotolerans]|uniref:tRNA (adenine(22)-N(1))-methyltransferase n=1 Tax=Virgibacillus halotolerans TaxID=1071053 RepID=UPI001960190B|nr:tRNA (adenine(22)-N(1))-methyltransferase TrmK [Virgibacillus halotolerans]MBM7597943.1 tRNA (adenine22-N1)-methyltransferase [Virgibacillus halotolerans]